MPAESMSLSQLAIAAAAVPKWVKNAEQVLGASWERTAKSAWQLALTREMNADLGLPLARAVTIARSATKSGIDRREVVVAATRDATVGVAVDLRRSRSNFIARLSRALILGTAKRRGRPPRRSTQGLESATAYGVDIDLLRASLQLSAGERLERLDANATFIRSIRRSGRQKKR